MLNIDFLLLRAGYKSKDELSKAMGIHRAELYAMLGNNPRIQTLKKLAKVLNCRPSDLVVDNKVAKCKCPNCGKDIEIETIDERKSVTYTTLINRKKNDERKN